MALVSYSRVIAEAFGFPPGSSNAEAPSTWTEYRCPFTDSRCVKPSQHRDYPREIPFGACSVWHRGRTAAEPAPHIICPVRFTQNNLIFTDAAAALGPYGRNDHVLLLPEVSTDAGRLDYVLVKYDAVRKFIRDFCILEVMAVSTTTTGHALRSLHDFLNRRQPTRHYAYGINWRQVVSRMIVQVLAKAAAAEQWQKKMIWAIQDVLYDFMQSTTSLQLEDLGSEWPRSAQPILLLVYHLDTSSPDGFQLRLSAAKGGSKEQLAQVLEPTAVAPTQVVQATLANRIERKQNVFDLTDDPEVRLGKVAEALVRRKERRDR